MAEPIRQTPPLKGINAKRFVKQMKINEKKSLTKKEKEMLDIIKDNWTMTETLESIKQAGHKEAYKVVMWALEQEKYKNLITDYEAREWIKKEYLMK